MPFLKQMRTKADIIPASSGGMWSNQLPGSVPPHPSQLSDEDFNIITYRYMYTGL